MRGFSGTMRSFVTLSAVMLLRISSVSALSSSVGCSICPNDMPVVGLPDQVVPAGTAGVIVVDQTCADTEMKAMAGAYSPANCVLLRAVGISIICGCTTATATKAPAAAPVVAPTKAPVSAPTKAPVPAPTKAPVAAPTKAPVAAPTKAPVAAPTKAPVAAPTKAPVAAPTKAPVAAPTKAPLSVAAPTKAPAAAPTNAPVAAPTKAPLSVAAPTKTPAAAAPSTTPAANHTNAPAPTSVNVTATPVLAPTAAPALAPAPAGINGTVDINLNATSGPLTTSTQKTYQMSQSRLLRALQANNTKVLKTTIQVAAKTSGTANSSAFESLLVNTTNTNSADFVNMLQNADNFFSTVVSVNAVPLASPTTPTSTPAKAPTAESPSSEKKLSGGAIAGIVIAVFAVIALIAGISVYSKNANNPQPPRALSTSNSMNDAMNAPTTIVATTSSAKVAAASVESNDEFMVPADRAKSVSTIGAGDAAGSVATGSEYEGGDTMSYAYSLDAGNVDQQTAAKKSGTSEGGGPDSTSQSGDEMSSHAMSSLRQNMVSRTVIAPPGKLGIVIDTTLEGPVVHKINPQSPLEGTLFPGDIIVAIDDVDTRAMSASAITALMVRTANLRRKLTVLSEDVTN